MLIGFAFGGGFTHTHITYIAGLIDAPNELFMKLSEK